MVSNVNRVNSHCFFGQVSKNCMYSCNVSSALCLWCRSLAACTSVDIGEYTSSSFPLMSCQSRLLPNLFNNLEGVLFDLAVASLYPGYGLTKLLFKYVAASLLVPYFSIIYGMSLIKDLYFHVYLLCLASY